MGTDEINVVKSTCTGCDGNLCVLPSGEVNCRFAGRLVTPAPFKQGFRYDSCVHRNFEVRVVSAALQSLARRARFLKTSNPDHLRADEVALGLRLF
jgi:hypothetical protein